MNVHYQDWYSSGKGKAPTDTQKTNPIIFLTVAKGSKFQTVLGANENLLLNQWDDYQLLADRVGLNGDATILDLAAAWLRLTLTNHGIGAKTAVGYGYMNF